MAFRRSISAHLTGDPYLPLELSLLLINNFRAAPGRIYGVSTAVSSKQRLVCSLLPAACAVRRRSKAASSTVHLPRPPKIRGPFLLQSLIPCVRIHYQASRGASCRRTGGHRT